MFEPRELSGISDFNLGRFAGALEQVEADKRMVEDAYREMVEARFLIATGCPEQADQVLARGILRARFALNLSDVEPE